jgi:hypothetical protein
MNGWKIKLPEADRTVRVTGGILATADNSDPFVNPDGAFTVRVEREAPGIAIGYSTSGGQGATAAQVWNYGQSNGQTAEQNLVKAKNAAQLAATLSA